MSWLSRMAERQIQRARLKGQLQGLEGEGKPLPDRPGDAFVSPGDAVGFRIMAEAGVLPEEITLKKRVAEQRKKLAALTDVRESGKRVIPHCPYVAGWIKKHPDLFDDITDWPAR